jgi:uncharacterized protein
LAIYFFDSSALVKRYVSEVGSAWVCQITDPRAGNNIYIAEITGVEVVAALMRKARQTQAPLPLADARRAVKNFRDDLNRQQIYDVVSLTAPLLQSAMALPEKHKLRGYDAVQLAAALAIRNHILLLGTAATGGLPFVLVSCDSDLLAATQAEGVAVDNPRHHP